MSEEENIEYKNGDIVWVKLGSFWWPGEVTNHAPEDVITKKTPVAIVKFFGEDTYECVTNHKNIYPYNCSRKNEFIKKGMDSYHGKNSQVEKFPLDINTAETRTDGNVNILYDVYSQQKKTNIVAEVFGTPATKKSKNGPHRYRHKKTSKQKSPETIRKSIKHRRFLGCDDYEMRIRVQYPGKDVEPTDEDRVPVFEDEIKKFPCSTCGFITDRLEVMLFHVQCHIKGIHSPTTSVPKEKKKTPKKSKKIIRELSDDDDDNNGIDDDDENANDGGDDTLSSIDSEEDKVKRKQKRKRKSQGSGKMKQKKMIDQEKPTIDIRTNLLAEWSDSEDIDQDTDTSKLNTSTDSTDDTKINQNNESSLNETKKNDNKDDKSCFDFEEDEDDDNSIVQTAVVGRKIPRVIPPADRRKSTEPDNENASLPLAEDDETRVGHLNKVNSSSTSNSTNNSNNNNNNSENLVNESSSSILNDESNSTKDNSEFKELMESTTVPELPEVTDANKTQNLPIKLPEKPKIDNSTEVATRLTNPKKRFVKSFEDFELLLNEQKKAMEEVELAIEKTENKQEQKDNKQEKKDNKQKKKDNKEEKKDNKEEKKDNKEEKKDNKQEKKDNKQEMKDNKQEMKDNKQEKKDNRQEKKDNRQEKKDNKQEKKDNEQEMEIEEKTIEKKEIIEKDVDKNMETDTNDEKINKEQEIKTQDTDKEIMKTDKKESLEKTDVKQKADPEKITQEVEAKLEISKLKCQIMSKITDEEQQRQQQKQQQQHELAKSKTKSSHRTPRSKILESYRNDTNEKKRRKSTEEKMDDSNKQHDKHPPKKSKYLRSSNDEEEKIEQKTDNEIIVENKVEDNQEIIETKINETVEENKVEKLTSSDLVKETVDDTITKTSIETSEKPVEEQPDKVDDNQEVSVNLDDKQDDNEVVKFDKEEEIVEDKINNDVEMKNDADQTTEEFPIKTNLTNDEEMSALTTLATISQLQTTFDNDSNKSDKVETESIPATSFKPSFDEQFISKTTPILPNESELVPIDGNLTVVSEKDLADAQVEITADISPTNKKPVTLTTFSMDFSETPTPAIITNDNNENVGSSKIEEETLKLDKIDEKKNIEAKMEEKIKESVIEIPPVSNTSILDEICDVEEHIPSSQIVCTQESNLMKDDKLKVLEKNPSKLLERLTTIATTHTKESIKSTKAKVQSLLTNEPKVPISKLSSSSSSSSTTTATLTSTTTTTTTTTTTAATTTKQIITKPLTAKIQSKASTPKAIIISEQIIQSETPVIGENANTVSVQKISSKRNMQDPDEIDTFIIHKSKAVSDEQNNQDNDDVNKKSKKSSIFESKTQVQIPTTTTKKRGKAKILQQTIITPSGEIVQPTIPTTQNQTQNNDENVFDINSMPIVLSDQILTPESIENMPIFLSDSSQTATEIVTTPTTKLITTNIVKKPTPSLPQQQQSQQQQQQPMKILSKTMIPSTVVGTVVDKTPKIVKTTTKFVSPVGSKILKSNSFTPGIGNKQGKFVIVSQGATITPTTTSKYTVGKKHIIKRPASEITGTLAKVQNVTSEPSGNKIMILTNQQGQQQKVLLTPAQQKLMGYQAAGTKVTKTLVKGNVIQKTATPGTSGLLTKTIVHSPATTQRITTTGQTLITSSGQLLTPIAGKSVRIEKQPILSRKIPIQSQKVNIKGPPHQKTILIKNQHGQTVRKIQGTDEELLNQQVKEQIEAIKASGGLAPPPPQLQPQQQQQLQVQTQQKSDTSFKGTSKTIRRSYAKKIESPKAISKPVTTSASVSNKTETIIPPLTPISPKKAETTASVVSKEKVAVAQSQPQQQQQQQTEVKQSEQQRPLNQLVIQDAMGNQTTITEGQILALPSETVDGQPQSYMLVTLDESGNLTPLNNEALMSLDPNLGLSGDLGNTVLQIDQSALKDNQIQNENINVEIPKTTDTIPATITKTGAEIKTTEQIVETAQQQQQPAQQQVPNEPTPAALQTVNCSVSSDGNGGQQLIVTGDPVAAQKFLESLTEGNTDLANILMNAEGSILVHADGQQILINTDTDNQMLLSMAETSEGGGNPIFATQPTKNQDILAAALADTDVFQQEQNAQQGNVLETSLTLNSPIMTPLEVPSTNSKKISDENDILTQVPKNVDLPITITDPNISQTVAQQQVASMMANELQNNLELTLPDTAISVTSSEMNSPSFVYSLPNLDESVDINQKPFNSSMPLLTEDTEETIVATTTTEAIETTTTTTLTESNKEIKTDEKSSKSEDINQEREESDENKDELETTSTASTTVSTTTKKESATITPIVSTTTVASTTTTAVEVRNFLEDTGLCSLGGEMCSSLSEPPPDMFDLTAVLSTDVKTNETETKIDKSTSDDDDKQEQIGDDKKDLIEGQSNTTTTDKTIKTQETTNSPNSLNEDSCEIPVQPEIVTNLTEFNQNLEKNHSSDAKDGKN